MPWKETTTMSERSEFIEQAKAEGANVSALCREYGISRKTGYKWLSRERAGGCAGLVDQSRRPKHSPEQTGVEMEAQVLKVREDHPAWGGRKIRRVLQNQGTGGVPAASTITAILGRNQHIDRVASLQHQPMQRFERERPNELWQMDFKGYFALPVGGYCHPLTVIDDHSRFLVGLQACPNETAVTVQEHLTLIFRQFGLPEQMLMDNGSPWGDDWVTHHTIFTAWLLRLEIGVSHGRPYHPQTQGKDERLNRTLKDEVIRRQALASLLECQAAFDQWWHIYNYDRPHDALDLDTPAAHYEKSPRPFPEVLPPVTYPQDDVIRKVDQSGKIYFHNRSFRVGKAFRYQAVALRPAQEDGKWEVFFCKHKVAQINLRLDNLC
jgi:transposase InsO family protein